MSGSGNYPEDSGYLGQMDFGALGSEFAGREFHIRQILSQAHHCQLVQVIACTGTGDVAPIGQVDVLPLVNQIDGNGNPTPHMTVYGLPYFRLTGGTNAIIMDPVAGDQGIAVFADRDISTAKSTLVQSNPGSRRKFDMADGLYLGAFLSASGPSQYIQFQNSTLTIFSPGTIALVATEIDITAPTVTINASTALDITSPMVAITGTSLTHNGVNVGSTHMHGGVQTGGGETGPPM